MAVITRDKYATVFSWKGESIKEYWWCIMNLLICTEDDCKVHRPDLIVDDGLYNIEINIVCVAIFRDSTILE